MLFAALLVIAMVPANAWRARRSSVVIRDAFLSSLNNTSLVSIPRGGSDSRGSVGEEKAAGEDDDDGEKVEETIESVVEEIEAEVEEIMEEVAEEIIEAEVEAVIEAEIEEEAEDDEEDVFPTDEIPSDDVRYNFHTTDGELADDEGMYTDGQNESPIADNDNDNDNEVAEAAAVRGGDDGDMDGEDDPEGDVASDSTAVRTAASVAVLDDDLKKVLMTDLRYTKDDVAMMRPDVAADIVRNKLRRPIEGMPPNFYSDPEVAAQKCKPSLLARNKGLILSVAAVGAAAVSVGVLKENDSFGDAIEDIADALKGIPKSVMALVVVAKRKISRKGEAAPEAAEAEAVAAPASGDESEEEAETGDEEPKEEAKETGGFGGGQNQRMSLKKGLKSIKLKDRSLASIKPGATPKELKATGYDDTWLDKLITRIGDVFDLIFKAKI